MSVNEATVCNTWFKKLQADLATSKIKTMAICINYVMMRHRQMPRCYSEEGGGLNVTRVTIALLLSRLVWQDQ